MVFCRFVSSPLVGAGAARLVHIGLVLCAEGGTEAGDGAEAVELLALNGAGRRRRVVAAARVVAVLHHGSQRRQCARRVAAGSHLLAVESVDSDGRRLGRRPRAVGRLVDVFTVDVNSVGNKRRATVAAASVALLEAENLELGLDSFEEGDAHCVCLLVKKIRFRVSSKRRRWFSFAFWE